MHDCVAYFCVDDNYTMHIYVARFFPGFLCESVSKSVNSRYFGHAKMSRLSVFRGPNFRGGLLSLEHSRN